MISVIFDSVCFKILTVFSLAPGKVFTRRALKDLTKVNNVPLDAALMKLRNSRMIVKEKKRYRLSYSKKWVMELINSIKRAHETMKSIPLDTYFAINDFTNKLVKQNCDVYLFGSYSKLNFTTDSDIDIAVISATPIDFEFVKALRRKYGKELQVHQFEPEFYKKHSDPFVKEVLEGVCLMKTLGK